MQKGGNRFYFDFPGNRGPLPEKEAHHLIRVCRKKPGDIIYLIDGKGKEFLGKILSINEKRKRLYVEVEILETVREEKVKIPQLIALIPSLKGDKSDFLVVKGTELGIHKFIIYYSHYTIPKHERKKIDRFKEKALSALKQSGRLLLPEIEIAEDLLQILKTLPKDNTLKLIATPHSTLSLKNLLDYLQTKPEKIFLLTGPEGGFSEKEIEVALSTGFIEIALAENILRAETASLSLMSLLAFFSLSLKAPH
ncbi:MAG: RsmE family RNA methyltransferase [Caldimicrobium sp.]